MAEKNKKNNEEKPKEQEESKPEEILTETFHTTVINGGEIQYKAIAGTLVLKEEDPDNEKGEQAKASIFYVAYLKENVGDPAMRPITFSFNGGPGSSSVWLHLGLLGPRRVEMADEIGNAPKPPYKLIDNEYSLLDETDLVFIDPVSTGFSRAVPGEKPKQFHEIEKDIQSVGDFIRLFTTRFERWGSAKFLIGESYGTTRAAGLSGYLQQRHGMYLNGVMLVSCILNFATARFDLGNDLPFLLFLPTYTATAWYHNRLSEDLRADLHKALKESEEFAMKDYLLALMKGDLLQGKERSAIRSKLARLTGLSEEYLEQTNLRIYIHRFVKELLRDERMTVGRLDTRFKGRDRDAAGENFEFDPSMAIIMGIYTGALNDYLRRDLKSTIDLPYEILTGKVWPWNYDKYSNQYVNVAETLRKAMTQNPFLKVLVANGYFDLATPYFATEYTFNHLSLEPELRENITTTYYEAGHMMYMHLPSLIQLKADLVKFLVAAANH